jgi:2-haloacid dehalogenase
MSGPWDVRAVVFDAYGTLLDLQGSLSPVVAERGAGGRALLELWRRKQLEYSWLRSLMQRHADFAVVTEESLDHAMAALGIDEPPLRARLLAAFAQLEAYPEVPAALRRLRGAGLATAVLSNGSPAMLATGLAAAGIAGLVDPVLSVEEVGIYKPAPEVYALACDRLGLPAERIAFLSGNGWDQAGAACFGLRVVAVRRADVTPERLPGDPVAVVRDLGELPPLLGV